MCQPQGRIASDCTSSVKDFSDSAGGHANQSCEGCCAPIKSYQFLGEMYPGKGSMELSVLAGGAYA